MAANTVATVPPTAFQSTSLYVGDLAVDITEGNLFELFNTVGPVASIRVCRDNVTRRSLGYAYVNFHSAHDAERALDTLNNSQLRGRPIRVMWSQRDPSVRKSGVGNIFIKNLDKTIDHKALYDTFSDFGNILSCKVALDDKGVSKGYGFVHYETQKMADEAIQKVNGCAIGGNLDLCVYVGPFISKRERQQHSAANFTNVFVKNLPVDASDVEVNDLFSQCGKITSGVVMKDESGASKGFGFFNFETHEQAKAAVETLNNFQFKDKTIYVARAQKKSERRPFLLESHRSNPADNSRRGTNLYVKNLDDNVTDAEMKEQFKKFGQITSAVVMKDDKGVSKGFGFVCYSTPEEANKALNELNGKAIWSKPLYVSFFQRREERRAHLEAQYRMGGGRPRAPVNVIPPMFPFTQPNIPMMYPHMLRQNQNRWNAPQMSAPFAQSGLPYVQMQGQVRSNQPIRQFPPAAAGAVPQARPGALRPGVRGEKAEEPLTVDYLSQYAPEHQFLMVSQRLYPVIMKAQPELAPKITGMLRSWYLEHHQGPEELLRLLEDPAALNAKIAEAMEIWEEHVRSSAEAGAQKENPQQ